MVDREMGTSGIKRDYEETMIIVNYKKDVLIFTVCGS
jgi:hypothetical protein